MTKRGTFSISAAASLFLFVVCSFAGAQSSANGSKYFFVLLKRPASAPQMSDEALNKLQDEHMANIGNLHAEKKLVMAGPFTDDTTLRGIFVFRADSMQQVQEWTSTDPAIHAGRLAAEIHGPWLIDANAIHDPANPHEGMEQYSLVLLEKGGEGNPHQSHASNATQVANMAVGGLFTGGENNELQGVEIFCVGTEATAKIVQDDPTVKDGFLKTEIHPWITAKGVLAPGQPMKP